MKMTRLHRKVYFALMAMASLLWFLSFGVPAVKDYLRLAASFVMGSAAGLALGVGLVKPVEESK